MLMDSTEDKVWRLICQRLERNTFRTVKQGKKKQNVKEKNNGGETEREKSNRGRIQRGETCGNCKYIDFVISLPIPPAPGTIVQPKRIQLFQICCCSNPNADDFLRMLHTNYGCDQFEARMEKAKIKIAGRIADGD